MAVILEHDEDTPVGPDDVDGMQEYMEEADTPLSTDWDIDVENPPHEGYDGPLPHPELAIKPA
jgi:hypothetical protein